MARVFLDDQQFAVTDQDVCVQADELLTGRQTANLWRLTGATALEQNSDLQAAAYKPKT